MSMLYVWNPTLLDEGRTLQVMITRGDSDQVGKGSSAFLTAILTAVGAKATPKGARIERCRCNYYSEHWEEPGWESRWDLVWRCRIRLAAPLVRFKSATDYVGIDAIDEYNPTADSQESARFQCLAVAEFTTEKAAANAAAAIAKDPDVSARRRTTKGSALKSDTFKIAPKRFHLHIELGSVDVSAVEKSDAHANVVVEKLEALGGSVHASQ